MTRRRDEELDRVRATYQRYARDGRSRLWDRANPGYARIARERDEALVELIVTCLGADGAGTVLDCGCGTGELADLVRARAPRVAWTGIDLRTEALEVGRRDRPWGVWVEGSVDALPFPDGSFDVVVASTLFSSLPSWELELATAREIARVLAPDGAVVWYDLRYGSPRNRAVHPMSRRRIERLFPGWIVDLRSITLLPPLARRLPGGFAWVHAMLSRVPLARSHLVGRVRPQRSRRGLPRDPLGSNVGEWRT